MFVDTMSQTLRPLLEGREHADLAMKLLMILPHPTLIATKSFRIKQDHSETARNISPMSIHRILYEAKALQLRPPKRISKKVESELKSFNEYMSHGKISSAIRGLSEKKCGGVLSLIT